MYICKNLRLMNYLVRQGFDVLKIEPDRYKIGRVVFCFADCSQIREYVNKYYELLNKR